MAQRVFIHCGLHKTGTTAIQLQLQACRNELRDTHTILYPDSLDAHAGHHNIAWQLAGDKRFDASGLTVARAVTEVIAFAGDAVLSSEDFESILHKPAALAPLVRPLREAGCEVQLLVYFRDVSAYVEKLYLELLLHGYAGSYSAFAKQARSKGKLRYRDWVFQLDYQRTIKTLENCPDFQLKAFDYDNIARVESVVSHFFAQIGAGFSDPDSMRAHARPTDAHLLCCYVGNIAQRQLTASEIGFIHSMLAACEHNPSSLALERVYAAHTAREIIHLAARPNAARQAALISWWTGGARSLSDYFRRIALPWR